MSDQIDIKPIAFITGYVRGYLTIKTLDPSLVLPPKMALYSYEDVLNAVKAEREACLQICIDAQKIEIYQAENDFEKGQITMVEYLQSAIKERGEVK